MINLITLASNAALAAAPSLPTPPLKQPLAPKAEIIAPAGLTLPPIAIQPRLRPEHARRASASPQRQKVEDANRKALHEPRMADFVNAVQVYPWSEGALYRLFAAPERISDIALQPGETLVSVGAGDTVRWIVGDTSSGSGGDKRTHVLVKPTSAGLRTNLVIATDRRVYHLQLESTAGTARLAVSWIYPQDALLALTATPKPDGSLTEKPTVPGVPLDRLSFGYTITGDKPSWRPLRAFDDGQQTYIEMPSTLRVDEAPPLFLRGADGTSELVNYRLSGSYYVVDRLFAVAELRMGGKRQQVVAITRDGAVSKGRRGKRRAS